MVTSGFELSELNFTVICLPLIRWATWETLRGRGSTHCSAFKCHGHQGSVTHVGTLGHSFNIEMTDVDAVLLRTDCRTEGKRDSLTTFVLIMVWIGWQDECFLSFSSFDLSATQGSQWNEPQLPAEEAEERDDPQLPGNLYTSLCV